LSWQSHKLCRRKRRIHSGQRIVWENENKIYFLEDTSFYLLFDFDVEIGDTIEYYEPINKHLFSSIELMDPNQGPFLYRAVVTDIGEITISGVDLRDYNTQIIFPDVFLYLDNSFIENIGSNSQKFTGDTNFYVAEGCFGGLQCYNNGTLDYKTSLNFQTPNPSCDLLDSIDESEIDLNISIFPNPTKDLLTIESSHKINKIELLTINGQSIKSLADSNSISVADLPAGLYLLSVKAAGAIEILKFIKE